MITLAGHGSGRVVRNGKGVFCVRRRVRDVSEEAERRRTVCTHEGVRRGEPYHTGEVSLLYFLFIAESHRERHGSKSVGVLNVRVPSWDSAGTNNWEEQT